MGRLCKAHGLKGGVVLQLYNPVHQESVLKVGLSVFSGPASSNDSNSLSKLTISKIQVLGDRASRNLILHFQEISSIEEIQKILPGEVKVERSFFPELPPGEYYIADLIGLQVFDHHHQKLLGQVSSTYFNGANDIIVIELLDVDTCDACTDLTNITDLIDQADLKDRQLELPLIDKFFPVIDINRNRIEVEIPRWK